MTLRQDTLSQSLPSLLLSEFQALIHHVPYVLVENPMSPSYSLGLEIQVP